jgi:carbon monoxide dehydrogenase subunit G
LEVAAVAGFKRTIYVDRPVEAVFDFATDLSNASRLIPGITRAELITEGGMKTGAKFRETRRVGKRERTAVIEVVEHKRPEVHTARAAMMGMSAAYTFRFAPKGPGTQVDMEAQVRGNLLWKLFLGMMSRMMEKEDGQYLERLKLCMEGPPPS